MPKKEREIIPAIGGKELGFTIRVFSRGKSTLVEITPFVEPRAPAPPPVAALDDDSWDDSDSPEDVACDEAENPDEIGDENDDGPRVDEIDVVPL